MRTRRSPRNQESMLRIVSGIKDKQSLIMNNAKQRERIAELEAELAVARNNEAVLAERCKSMNTVQIALAQQIAAAQADAARLRAALQEVEFVYDDVCGYCPWCNANDKDRIIGDDNYVIQHKPDCRFRAALAQTSEVKA